MNESFKSVAQNFIETASEHGDRNALFLENSKQFVAYGELLRCCVSAACQLQRSGYNAQNPCLLLTGNSYVAYAGLMAIVISGGIFVPTNVRYPAERNLAIARGSMAGHAILDPELIRYYAPVLDSCSPLTVVMPECNDSRRFSSRWPRHRFVTYDPNLKICPDDVIKARNPDDILYILYTSGSTGVPKGVAVPDRGIRSYLECAADGVPDSTDGRFMQLLDLTFDVAEHPLWRALLSGGCLYLASETSRLFPLKFILEHRISEIVAVPTTVVQMNRLGMLKKDSMPCLRYAGFCGEPLPSDAAAAFCQAAPGAIVENLYGPTEATIACAFYRIHPHNLENDSHNGIVPAGRPYRSTRTMITNQHLKPVPDGETGELMLSGSQLACGYWNDTQKTAASFIRVPGTDGIWYRTGDLVRIKNGNICYVGRNDGMVKISGFRVELSEVDITVKKAAKTDMAVTVAARHENENRLICFIPDSCGMTDAEIIGGCRQRIPAYMIPTKILRLAQFPQNFNGKIDRKELTRLARSALLEDR